MSQQIIGYSNRLVVEGESFDSLALSAYSEERMASTIIAANPDLADVLIFEGGEVLRIPIVNQAATPETLPPWRR